MVYVKVYDILRNVVNIYRYIKFILGSKEQMYYIILGSVEYMYSWKGIGLKKKFILSSLGLLVD